MKETQKNNSFTAIFQFMQKPTALHSHQTNSIFTGWLSLMPTQKYQSTGDKNKLTTAKK